MYTSYTMFTEILLILALLGSMVMLVKGADYLIESGENIGVTIGLTPFVIGIIILGFGTSLPEFATAISSILHNNIAVPAAVATGSNIANTLFVIGVLAIVAKKLVIDKDLIELELPLLFGITVLFISVGFDGVIVPIESLLLVVAFVCYMIYSVSSSENYTFRQTPSQYIRRLSKMFHDIPFMFFGIVTLTLGAHYVIISLESLANLFNLSSVALALTLVAIGTSLPELSVSLRSLAKGKTNLAFGNIIGSNVFNLTFVVGVTGLFSVLSVGDNIALFAFPVLLAATILLIISAISKKIYLWEGIIYILIYIYFLLKIYGVV